MPSQSQSSAVRYALGGLLAFGALNAFAGGYYGLSGAKGVPVEWLQGSPFKDYSVPSLILFIVVGGSFLIAAIAIFARARIARASALTAGALCLSGLPCRLPSSVPLLDAACDSYRRRPDSVARVGVATAWLAILRILSDPTERSRAQGPPQPP